jgi:hypothetical protein
MDSESPPPPPPKPPRPSARTPRPPLPPEAPTAPRQLRPSRTLGPGQVPSTGVARGTAEEAADELEKAQAILDVVQHSARFTRAVAFAKPIESYLLRPIILAAIAVLMLVVTGASYATRAEWLFGANPTPPSADRREGYQRFTMYLLAHRVNHYRAQNNGRMPPSLAAVGEDWPGIEYAVVDLRGRGVFELRSEVDGQRLTYRSSQDVDTFLAGSERFLRNRFQ